MEAHKNCVSHGVKVALSALSVFTVYGHIRVRELFNSKRDTGAFKAVHALSLVTENAVNPVAAASVAG